MRWRTKPRNLSWLGGQWRQHPRYRGCTAHFLCLEGGGGTVADVAGYGNVGTLTSMEVESDWQIGERGPYLEFATDDYVNFATARLNNFGDYSTATGFSVTLWCKTSAVAQQGAFRVYSAGQGHLSLLMLPTGLVRFQYRTENNTELGAGIWDGVTAINNGQWHHVVLLRNGTTFEIYVDGKNDKTGTAALGYNTLTGSSQVFGTWAPGIVHWTGSVDDVRMYRRALSPAEIWSLWQDPFLEFAWAAQTRQGARFAVIAAPQPGTLLPKLLQHNHFTGGMHV